MRTIIVILTGLLGLVAYFVGGVWMLVQVIFLGVSAFFGWRVFWSRSAMIGAAAAVVAMFLAALFSPAERDAIGLNTVYKSYEPDVELGFPVPFLVFASLLAIPSLIAGGAVAKLSMSRMSAVTAYLGIVLGCWWRIHLSFLLAEISRAEATVLSGQLIGFERLDGSSSVRLLQNAEYMFLLNGGVLVDLVVSFLPLFCSLALLWVGNQIVKRRSPERHA